MYIVDLLIQAIMIVRSETAVKLAEYVGIGNYIPTLGDVILLNAVFWCGVFLVLVPAIVRLVKKIRR